MLNSQKRRFAARAVLASPSTPKWIEEARELLEARVYYAFGLIWLRNIYFD